MADNALANRRAQAPPTMPGSDRMPAPTTSPDAMAEGEFAQMANSVGLDIAAEMDRGTDPQQVLQAAADAIWERMPTDDAGAAIEAMAAKYGLTPPWAKEQQQAPAPQQQMPPGQMPQTMPSRR